MEQGLTRNDAEALAQRILAMSQVEQARVNIEAGRRGYTRVAVNRITSAGDSTDVSVRITSAVGRRVASVTTNQLDDAALRNAVRRSEQLAHIAPEDPEYMGEIGPLKYPKVDGFYRSTGRLSPEATAAAGSQAANRAAAADLVAAGYIDTRAGSETVATTKGCFAHHTGTGVASTLTVRTPDGEASGWAGGEAADWKDIDSERIALNAAAKCEAWRGKTELEPGTYTAVLEPTAVGMLMLRMMGAFDARQADEGRSYFSDPDHGNRLGQQLFDERITIRSDPAERGAETAPFNGIGLPVMPRTWIANGALRTLDYSLFWAWKNGIQPIAPPTNLFMEGGDATVEDMIASTDRGVLVTRFWYIRGLNPPTLSYTGLTRDGTFLIENGRITRPVKNFRFNQSLAEMLQNVETLGAPIRVAAGENSSVGAPIVVPALKVRNFNFASVSDAI